VGEFENQNDVDKLIYISNYLLKNGSDGNISVDWGNRNLYTSVGDKSIDWENRRHYNSAGNIVLDAESRVISGAWTTEQLHGLKVILTGSPPTSADSPGISGQLAVDKDFLYLYTGIGWGRTQFSRW
jgi:hypothetical protein